jgi:hypothetical protein
MQLAKIYGSISKVDDNEDGTITVHGIASSECRDHSGEIVLADAMKSALPAYSKFPALREMHQPLAAGKVVEAEVDETGVTHIAALVVDPIAIQKVKTGVYLGFSIGGKVLKRDPEDRSIITALRLVEISLVDSPCNPDATLSMWKADMTIENPTSAEVIARAKDLAKASGSQRFREFLFEAREAIVSERTMEAVEKGDLDLTPPAEPEAEAPVAEVAVAEETVEAVAQPAAEAAVVETPEAEAEVEAPAAVAEAEAAPGSEAPVVETIEAAAPGAEVSGQEAEEAPAGEEVVAEEPKEASALVAALTASIEKGQALVEGAAPAEEQPAADPFADIGKAAAALRAISVGDDELKKGLYSVSRFADLLESFCYLASSAQCEADCEGDQSPVPAKLAEAVRGLGAILIEMAQEEVAEMLACLPQTVEIIYLADGVEAGTVELAGQIVDLVKANAPLLEKIGGSTLAKRGPAEGDADARVVELEAEVEGLTKALGEAGAGVEKMVTGFEGTVTGLRGEIETLTKRFEELDQTPVPARTAGPAIVRTVEKGQDSLGLGGGSDEPGLSPEQFDKAWQGLTPLERGEILLKHALARPQLIAQRG